MVNKRSHTGPLRSRRNKRDTAAPETLHLFGLHAVRAALRNPNRHKLSLSATSNALAKLAEDVPTELPTSIVDPRKLDQLLGSGAVHQGVALEVRPLQPIAFEPFGYRSCLILDQVTDPHNVGAILRSAAAFGFEAVLSTARHSAPETATLAKSASGALDVVKLIRVSNLSKSIDTLRESGMVALGLDSGAKDTLDSQLRDRSDGSREELRVALVLGSEGRGLRQKTSEACDAVCAIPHIAGEWYSLNVSNAAAIAMYAVKSALAAR